MQMINETIKDIRSFVLILFTIMIAYFHIQYTLNFAETDQEIELLMRRSFTLAFADFPDYTLMTRSQFFVFMLFSLIITLVLMNMLIAIMSDTYERMQANVVVADLR